MNKWHGKIGFVITKETTETYIDENNEAYEVPSGIWEETAIERTYFGDVIKNTLSSASITDSTNSDVKISVRFSILINPFFHENLPFIKYLEYMGNFWSVESVDIEYPRAIISIGGVWNGKTAEASNGVVENSEL